MLRLAELLCPLAAAADSAAGLPPETGARTALIGMRLAEHCSLGGAALGHLYYAGLLRHLGCSATAHEETDLMGDEQVVDGDLVERSTRGQLAGEEEYVLRHGLVRDAAYALLPDTERASAHELTGRWLESVGYDDASALAEHFDRAGVHDRALHHFGRAAQSALDGQDLARASSLVARARAHASTDEDRGALDALDADIAFVRGQVAEATTDGERALTRLRPGSRTWFRAASLVISSAGNQGDNERVSRWASNVATSGADADALGDRVVALARAVGQLAPAHEEQRVDAIYERFEALAAEPSTSSAYVAGVAGRSRGFYLLWRRGDFFQMRDEATRAADAFERAGMRNDQLNCLVLQGVAQGQTGDLAGGLEGIRSAQHAAAAAGLRYLEAFARMELGVVLALHGHGTEALEEASASLDVLRGSQRLTFHARHAMAMAALSAGDARRAVDEATLAARASVHPRLGSRALAVQAEAHLALGDAEQALACARQAVERGAAAAGWEICEGHCELALAEALEAAGDYGGARMAASVAITCISRLAAFAPTPEQRAAFLAVPIPNARIGAFVERLRHRG
jgi:tetratricopeptide (TPR) repeat protein